MAFRLRVKKNAIARTADLGPLGLRHLKPGDIVPIGDEAAAQIVRVAIQLLGLFAELVVEEVRDARLRARRRRQIAALPDEGDVDEAPEEDGEPDEVPAAPPALQASPVVFVPGQPPVLPEVPAHDPDPPTGD